ncbi:hypothetical protein [Tenacibaculum caenipelagi]|uniref:Uncharacterized protein n=1 Tax=Tenacibaculum caenipelagi TaxID=1325435 RepID=A0A4V3D355_9FLAO|nr:hypothetical protein [Tenacibaculum caenipelagi]TDQ27894.1 hypothetical protein DFQ07_1751 [Tenacibaculum caenipelagi]
MSIDWNIEIGSILSASIIAIGWVVAYRLNSKKDFKNKKRGIRLEYLIKAYRVIAFSSNRETDTKERKEFEEAIELIQFLGTPEQILFLEEGIKTRNFSPLLEELRRDLRKELELVPIHKRINHFRFSDK